MGHDVVLHPVLLSPVSCPIYHTEALYVLDALVTASPTAKHFSWYVPTLRNRPRTQATQRNATQRNANATQCNASSNVPVGIRRQPSTVIPNPAAAFTQCPATDPFPTIKAPTKVLRIPQGSILFPPIKFS